MRELPSNWSEELPSDWSALAILFVSLIVVATPAIGLLLKLFLPGPIPVLIALCLAVGGYGLYIILKRELILGTIIALLVLMTVAANIPLGSPKMILGGVGPQLFVVQIPLAALIIIFSVNGWSKSEISYAHILLFGFAIWCIVSAPLTAGPRPDMAVYFGLLFLQSALIFLVVSRSVQREYISAKNVIMTISFVVIGQSVLAFGQFLHRGPFGLSVLGEGHKSVSSLSLGPLGTWPTGPYVSGLAAAAALTSLITMVFPVLIVVAYTKSDWRRYLAVGMCVLMFFVIQTTAWDSARGAIILALVTSLILLRLHRTNRLSFSNRELGKRLSGALAVFAVAVLVPISMIWNNNAVATARSVSIPGFNTRNLAIRVVQYVHGWGYFIKYPIAGLGGANFYYVSDGFLPKPYPLHNLFIELLAETGIVGFVLYTGAIVLGLSAIWQYYRETRNPIALGVFSGLICYFALASFQPQLARPQILFIFWSIIGAFVGRSRGKAHKSSNNL